jgi:hypothetical protein
MIKDVGRFRNRDIKRTVLLDPKPMNFILNPDNGIPIVEYSAEFLMPNGQKETYLLGLMEEL